MEIREALPEARREPDGSCARWYVPEPQALDLDRLLSERYATVLRVPAPAGEACFACYGAVR